MQLKYESDNMYEAEQQTEEKELQSEDGTKIEVLQSDQRDKDEHTVDADDLYLTNPLMGPMVLTPIENKEEESVDGMAVGDVIEVVITGQCDITIYTID